MSENEVVNVKKMISVSDFKNWLSGIREFQPEDWVPNLDQWNKILGKIEDIEESVSAPQVSSAEINPEVGSYYSPSAKPQKNPQGAARPVRTRPQAPLDSGGAVKLPDNPVKVVPKQVTVEKVGVPTRDVEGKVLNTGDVYKTGVIDTSKGDYESQFK
jgi:hypothetical protein